MKTNFWPGIILSLALTGSADAQLTASNLDYTPLRIIQTNTASFPISLRLTSILNGEAWVVVRVDTEGQLVETLITGYTKPEFAQDAVDTLKGWKFKPATLHGEPWTTVREVHFSYSRTGVVISQTTFETLDSYIEHIMGNRYSFRAFQLRELDRIPVPNKVVQPSYPEALAAKGVMGKVTVEFYIDATGQVRMPAALEWSDDTLANLAVTAVKQWQFEPPLHDGKPVLVLIRQQFNFKPKT